VIDNKSTGDGRLAVIDVFRFLCIASVISFHYTVRWTPPKSALNLPELTHHFPSDLALGALGVHVFFIISGLVIPITLLRSKSIADFAVRRFARLYPTFLVCCTFSYLFQCAFGLPAFAHDIWTYLGNVSGAVIFGSPVRYIEGGYWSLAIELKFYVAAAFCWAFFGKRFWVGLLGIAIAGALTTQTTKSALWTFPEFLPLFLIGTGLWLWLLNGERRNGIALIAVSVGIFLFENHRLPPGGYVFILTLAAAMAAAIRYCPNVSFGPIAKLGQASYALYLINEHPGITAMSWLATWGLHDYLRIAVVVVGMNALAFAIFKAVEDGGKKRIMNLWRSGTFPAFGHLREWRTISFPHNHLPERG
jgi:peptidoglycan/LPS O-acetylase OafA/YrhL